MFKKFDKNIKMNFIYILFIFVCIFGLIYLKEIIGCVKKFIYVLNPFLYSIAIAFLLYPLVNKINNILDKIKKLKINRILSIIITYIIFIAFIAFICVFVLPDVINSLIEIIDKTPEYIQDITNLLKEKNIVIDNLDMATIQENVNIKIQEILKDLYNIVPQILEYSKSLVSILFSIFVAFVFSIYILIDLNRILGFLNYAGECLFGAKRNEKIKEVLFDCTSSINSFLTGKIIDSFIIGIIIFVILNIGGFKYALLISFIVGVTNIIPDIGPFIGAVPGIVIYLSISPKDALMFSIIILCVQQFDGMFLGPKILGKKLGIRPILILPSVIIGGYYFGIAGMVLGVPLISVLSTYISKYLEKRKKELQEKENQENKK